MMHTVFNLERPLVVFDLETTGLKVDQAHIVEMAFRIFTNEGNTKHWRSYINPGMPIPPETTATHHITDEMILKCRLCGLHESSHPVMDSEAGGAGNGCPEFKRIPKFVEIAAGIAKGFTGCDFAGKNIRYDLQVLDNEMKRNRVEWTYAGAMVIDADRLEQLGEPRSLSHLYEKHTGKKLQDAHSALADVDATVEVIVAQLKKYGILPRGLQLLHELQWPGWIDSEGKFRWKDGVATIGFGKHRDAPMRSVPPGYWRWITQNDFSVEVKLIASNAANGVFPTK